MKKIVKYRHRVNSGDLIAAMAGMKAVYDNTGGKAHIFQDIGAPAEYYSGAIHPVQNDQGVMVTMSLKQWGLLKPLLLSQEYVHKAEIYKGQKVHVNLDRIRIDIFANMPYGMLPSWVFFAYPDMAYDLSKSWMTIKNDLPSDIVKGKILLNFTQRYRNCTITYFFLKKHQKQLLFAGTKEEHDIFTSQWDLNIPYLQINDFLELATVVKYSKFILANQSTLWNIANAQMIPRLVELSALAPNCQPFVGERNYGFYNQGCLEYYFNRLLKETK